MDALALLCNLYGDGPATLKRLKSAGLLSVESLGDIEAQGLAETLGTSEAAARRFLREARLLGERMTESGFEEEASPPIAHQGPVPVPIIELEEAAQRPVEPGAESRAPLRGAGEHQPLEQAPAALGTGVSEREPGASGFEPAPAGVGPPSAAGPVDVGAAATPLELRLLDGLDRAWCERFAGLGLRSVEDLAGMDTLRVAGQLGEGLTRLDRFRFLARRHLASATEGDSPAVLVPRPPSSVPVTTGAAGALATEPWPAAPGAALKFSLAAPPTSPPSEPLAEDLDRAAEALDPDPEAAADVGSAGPFG